MRNKCKENADDLGKMQVHKKIQTIIWAAKEIIIGPKHGPIEKTAIYAR